MCLTIKDVLTRKVLTISQDICLAEAAQMMSAHRISCLVAVESDRPVGIITEADLVQVAHSHLDLEQTGISGFLSKPVISIETNHNIYDAFEILLERQVRHLVVVHPDGRLEGLLTFSDILKAAEFDDFLRIKSISSIMSCNVVTAHPDMLLIDVLARMDELHISCMVVVEDGAACGIFTERDTARLLASGADFDHLRLGEVMSAPLITMRANESVLDAALTMRKNGFRRLVIVDDQQYPTGLVTQFDVIRGLEGKTIHHFRALYEQVEEQLIAEKAELERIVDASPCVLFRCEWCGEDNGFIFTYVSASVTPMFGYEQRECLQAGWWLSHIHPDDVRGVEADLKKLSESGEIEHVYRFVDSNGDYRWVREHTSLKQAKGGGADELIGSLLDITESRQHDQQVYENEELYRSLVEQAFDGIAIVAADGRVIFVNASCAAAWGGKPDEMIGKHYLDIVHPDDRQTMQHYFQQRMDGHGMTRPYETRLIRKNGDSAWVELNGRLITWHDQPADLLTLHDITEHKRKERLLKRRERQLAVLARAGKIINELLDQQNIGRKLVKLACRLVDCKAGTVGFYQGENMCFREYLENGERIAIELDFPAGYGVPGHVMESRKPYVSRDALNDVHVIPEIQQALGFTRLADVPILDAGGTLLGCFEMHDRIDEEYFDDQDLEQAAMRMRTVLDADFDAVIVHQNFKVVFSNRAALDMFGFTAEQQVLGLDVIGFVDERYKRLVKRVGNKVVRTNRQAGLTVLRAINAKRNDSFPIEIASAPILWQGDKAIVSIVRDISERKRVEAQMRLLESAIASVNESIIITDADGVIVYVNSSFSRNTGFEVDDAIGKTPALLNSRQQTRQFYEQFWDTISHGQPWAGRILDRKKDGTIFPVYLSVAPIFDEKGKITHYVAVHEDLTRAESLQKKMIQAQKMEAVGTMVGGVAHDFNNMLAGIVGNFYLIRMQHPDDEKLQQRIRTMEEATRHGATLIQQMLTFARKDITDMHTLPLSSFIKEAYKLAAAAMPENIRLDLQMKDVDGVCVKADATQMQQVLLNLITNARHAVQDAMGDAGQGQISIEVDCRLPPEHLLQESPEMISDSGWCCIRCVDNGCGIEADDLEHVFEPFFTTKEVGKGTGLGLAMVYGAVQNHRGLVDIETTPAVGTTVSIWLPKQQAESVVVLGEDDVDVDGGGRLLLLVDDEEGLRKVLAEVLTHNGFTVLEAGDGEQAVKTFSDNHDQVALVLMDVVMPNKGGVVAAQEIRALDAEVPIVFQTGYGEQTQLDAAGSIANSESLQKPVQIHELLSMIMSKISH